ncbi:MAG: hypothetical protein ACP5E4_00420, partial [Candidatus Aenigmatarchaeota archaeon]
MVLPFGGCGVGRIPAIDSKKYLLAIAIFLLFMSPVYSLVIYTNGMEFGQGETLELSGLADSSESVVEASVSIYNSTGGIVAASSANSSGGAMNYFSVSIPINSSYGPGEYAVLVRVGGQSVNASFSVASEKLFFKSHLISSFEVKAVNTCATATQAEAGNNFSELIELSKSGTLHYGNASNLTGDGTNFTFVLVDQNYNGTYDTVYIDNSVPYVELWKQRSAGEKIAPEVNYVLAEIEYATGDKIYLMPPINDSVYGPGGMVEFVGLVENSTGFKFNESLNITLKDAGGNIFNSTSGQTDGNGTLVSSFTVPEEPGTYYLYINGTPVDTFSVEAFKLAGKITDLAGTPTASFSQNPKVELAANVKTLDGNAVTTANVTASLTYPNGTTVIAGTLTYDNNTKSYLKEISSRLEGAPNGNYRVMFYAGYGNYTQQFMEGFRIESIKLDVIAMNPQFMDEAEGSEAMVDAFAPGGKVSLMVMISDVSKGGIMDAGPESMGLIDIESGNRTCASSVSLVKLEDEQGNSVDTTGLNLTIVNLSDAVSVFGLEGEDEGPEEEMLKQCMIIFNSPQKTGTYKAKVKVNHALGEKDGTVKFGIQKLYAVANPVDFKGDEFWFYAPNSTLRIKLKVTNLLTREEVSAGSILSARIIEMYRVWPAFGDQLTGGYNPNASASNGTITFTSPNSEGFFMFKFKFKVNVSGQNVTGTGTGYFMLKKYMIWGEQSGFGEGGQKPVAGVGENITLTVHVVDVEKGSQMDLGQSGLSCSDNDNDGLPDCDGLEADINEIWNDQLMKRMESGTNYNVSLGVVRNSSASLGVIPIDLPTGWYGVDLILRDTVTNDSYFGWANFEIRNFWVDVLPIELKDDGNLSAGWGGGEIYGVGHDILFTAMAFDPRNMTEWGPRNLNVLNMSLESVTLDSMNGPPVFLEEGDYSVEYSDKTVLLDRGPEPVPANITLINLTLNTNKTGEYRANVRVTTSKGSDVGDFWLQVAPFWVDMSYRGMEEWPVIFSPDEVVEINISAYDFDDNPLDLNESKTRVRSFWNEKTGQPIKINANATNTTCSGNNCTIIVNLSAALGGQSGKYDMGLEIVDVNGNKKPDGIQCETRRVTVSIPNLKEVWVDQQSDTNKRELNFESDRDSCDNEKTLQSDGYGSSGTFIELDEGGLKKSLQDDNCPEAGNTTFCMDGEALNLTIPFNKTNLTKGGVYCLAADGSWADRNGSGECLQDTNFTYLVSNSTHIWVAVSNSTPMQFVNLSEASPLSDGDSFAAAGIDWYFRNIGKEEYNCNESGCGWTLNERFFRVSGLDFLDLESFVNHFNCSDQSVNQRFNLSGVYENNFLGIYCVLKEDLDGLPNYCECNESECYGVGSASKSALDWVYGACPNTTMGTTVYVASNTTSIWVNESLEGFNQSTALFEESTFEINGRLWSVSRIGKTEGDADSLKHFAVALSDRIKLNLGGEEVYLSVSNKYAENYAMRFCIREGQEWNEDWDDNCEGQTVYVVSNATHLWVDTSIDLTGASPLAEDDEFEAGNVTWRVVSVDGQEFRVNNAAGICGEMQVCDGEGCERQAYNIVPPNNSESFTTFYYGYIPNIIGNLEYGDRWFSEMFPAFNYSRPVYVFHNTTHVWISDEANFSSVAGVAVGSVLTDPYGGIWNVSSINRNKAVLRGINILAST